MCAKRPPARLASRLQDTIGAHTTKGETMLSTVLIVVLVLALIGALPTWPYSTGWGFYPSGGLGVIVLILIVLAVSGRL